MNKLLVKTLIASGVALSTIGLVHAADGSTQPGAQGTNTQMKQPSESRSSVGRYVDDATITTKVKAKHAEDEVVSMLGVDVETKKGVVILSGTAASPTEKARAEVLAKSVEGVKSVENDISIKAK